MAHTILSARPSLLTRSPAALRPLLKTLYGEVHRAMHSSAAPHPATLASLDPTMALAPSLFRKSRYCNGLAALLTDCNEKLFALLPSQVLQRIEELALVGDTLLSSSSSSSSGEGEGEGESCEGLGVDGWRVVAVLGAPRLLTDPTWRFRVRLVLLKHFFSQLPEKDREVVSLAVEQSAAGRRSAGDDAARMKELIVEAGNGFDEELFVAKEAEVFSSSRSGLDRVQALLGGGERRAVCWEGRAVGEFLLHHADVLICPIVAYVRLFFLLSRSDHAPSWDFSTVRAILKANTASFLSEETFSKDLRSTYARFLRKTVSDLAQLAEEGIANLSVNSSDEDEDEDEEVEALERQLCGSLNSFAAANESDTAMLLSIINPTLI
jgi:hypothetical protein